MWDHPKRRYGRGSVPGPDPWPTRGDIDLPGYRRGAQPLGRRITEMSTPLRVALPGRRAVASRSALGSRSAISCARAVDCCADPTRNPDRPVAFGDHARTPAMRERRTAERRTLPAGAAGRTSEAGPGGQATLRRRCDTRASPPSAVARSGRAAGTGASDPLKIVSLPDMTANARLKGVLNWRLLAAKP